MSARDFEGPNCLGVPIQLGRDGHFLRTAECREEAEENLAYDDPEKESTPVAK